MVKLFSRRLVSLTFLFLFYAINTLHAQNKKPATIAAYSIEDYQNRIKNQDTLYIVNYWATWCLPCVKELPYFEYINKKYKDQPIKVLLVSFDFPDTYPEQLVKWVEKKELKSEVIWFSNQNANDFIPIIAPEWEGNLPATLFINNKKDETLFIPNAIDTTIIENWIKRQFD